MNSMRCLVRFALVGALTLFIAAFAAPAPSHADTFNFTSDHCTGGCGTAPFGTVTLTQNGTTVDVVVALADGYSYVKSGAGDDQAFKFNGVDVVLGDITVDAHVPALVAATGAFDGDGGGLFAFGINCPSCGGGSSGDFTADISFHVANATIADLTTLNDKNQIFVADVLAPNGNTGLVDVSGPGGPIPEPTTVILYGLGLSMLAAGRKWRKARETSRSEVI